MMQGKTDDALAEFRKEQQVSPGDPRAYQLAAMYLAGKGQKDDAIAEWRKLLKADPKSKEGALNIGQLLSQEGKYSEAAQELETALRTSPNTTELQLALGAAYLKSGQPEKAVSNIRAAIEEKGDGADPMMLNNVAYTLAENKVGLDLAQQYGKKALAKLDEQSTDAEGDAAGLRITYQLSLLWDTVGWVYFQNGDAKRAESFVRAAWLLGQDAIVGEHLGEIYEKEGKTKAAAQVYELALAAQEAAAISPPPLPYSRSIVTILII